MFEELVRIENIFNQYIAVNFKNVSSEEECKDYAGYNFKIGSHHIKFRRAKITPKKAGHFVTLWKRNVMGQTEPFDETDSFDYCIILVEQHDQFGVFIFPKSVLLEKQIISTKQHLGKRGFRVYPDWVYTESSQAKKTQSWQSLFFVNLCANEKNTAEKLTKLLYIS